MYNIIKGTKGKAVVKVYSTIGPRLRLSDRPILINSRLLLVVDTVPLLAFSTTTRYSRY